jgi:transketolase
MDEKPSSGATKARESLVAACDRAIVELAGRDPGVAVFSDVRIEGFNSGFADRFPERFQAPPRAGGSVVEAAVAHAHRGGTAFAFIDTRTVGQLPYGSLWTWLGAAKVNVNLVARHPEFGSGGEGRSVATDLGTLRGIPGMTVVVPGDAPTAGEAITVLAQVVGPAYLRVTEAPLPRLSDGSLTLGKANELRAGNDLTIAAIGRMLAPACEVAEEFHRVGVEVRVLDCVSLQPADSKAILRAARETGAILTMEEHSTLTGLGALVATITAESYPVPVRRIGIPPVTGLGEATGTVVSASHARDEAWELLRMRGKVH